MKSLWTWTGVVAAVLAIGSITEAQSTLITVPLTYHAPGTGPKPNFSPKGTQVAVAAVAATQTLPPGAVQTKRKDESVVDVV
jgi:hypothetical protein